MNLWICQWIILVPPSPPPSLVKRYRGEVLVKNKLRIGVLRVLSTDTSRRCISHYLNKQTRWIQDEICNAVSLPYDSSSASLKSIALGKKKGKTSPCNSHRNCKCCRLIGDESKLVSYAGNTTPDALLNFYIIVWAVIGIVGMNKIDFKRPA